MLIHGKNKTLLRNLKFKSILEDYESNDIIKKIECWFTTQKEIFDVDLIVSLNKHIIKYIMENVDYEITHNTDDYSFETTNRDTYHMVQHKLYHTIIREADQNDVLITNGNIGSVLQDAIMYIWLRW
jgi:hypothetical protein